MTEKSHPPTTLHESQTSRVLLQTDSEYGRAVVIKVLKSAAPTSQELLSLNNEYEFGKDLVVEGTRRAIAYTQFDGKPALVLEYVPGQPLVRAFGDRKHPIEVLLRVAVRIAGILEEIHKNQIIHKNINSHNILVDLETGDVRIIDFGFASKLPLKRQYLHNPETLPGRLAFISPEQTGRMNRIVDHRTDLYSVGVTFYEMLTGRLPFESNDPLALVHAHLAVTPQPPAAIIPDLPPVLSSIVMKLLAKDAEDRYQSAFGLKSDLERCLRTLHDGPSPTQLGAPGFPLGQDDASGRLLLPQKLYGRSAETTRIWTAFQQAADGARQFVLVSGDPGVGKSALVAELYRPITAKHAYFVSGKFDQNQQKIPYSAFKQAFGQLMDALMTERESTLQRLRTTIAAALAGNGAVLTDVIPGLETVLGPQADVMRLDGEANRNRFNLTFQEFVRALSTVQHPLVVFIDDWQWADSASLELMKLLLTDDAPAHLLVIGAYRNNEVSRIHPFVVAVDELAREGHPAQVIDLENLTVEDVGQMVQDSLLTSPNDSRAITALVYSKTRGNAFFTRQFLLNLYEEGWLHYDFDAHHWSWDLGHIASQEITDNVVELMTRKLRRLSALAVRLLQRAACIGEKFDLQSLVLVSGETETTTVQGLKEIMGMGFIFPLDDYYLLPETQSRARFEFLHDRVHQSAYAQMQVFERERVHLEIGRRLLNTTPPEDSARRTFEIAQHFMHAGALVTEEAERLQVAALNVKAADLAFEASAYQSMLAYLESALTLMPPDSWDIRYDAMLRICSGLANACSLTGDTPGLEKWSGVVELHAHALVDTREVKLATIRGLLSQTRHAEAIELGLTFIESLGVTVNRNPSPEEALNYLRETADWLTESRIASLPEIKEASREVAAIVETAPSLNGPIYNANMYLSFMFVSRITRLCFEEGLSPRAPVTLMTFALTISGGLQDIPKARSLAEATRRLYNQRYPLDTLVPQMNVAIGGFLAHRYDHLRTTVPLFIEGIQKGLSTGDSQFVGWCAWWNCWHSLFLGTPLSKVEAGCQQAIETCQKVHMERMKDLCLVVHQVILNLQGTNARASTITGDACDAQGKLDLAIQVKDFAEVFRIHFYQSWLQFMFDEPERAVASFRESEAHLLFAAGLYVTPLFYFYDALANARLATSLTEKDRASLVERIGRNLEQLEPWVRYAPMNHLHKKVLIEAEKARITGDLWHAVMLYQKGIQGARENGFLNEEALAWELTGRFWLGQNLVDTALDYLIKSQALYSQWGAHAKVEQLQTMLDEIRTRHGEKPRRSPDWPQIKRAVHDTQTPDWLDMSSVLKANQALSQAVQVADVLTELLKILLENAGAERVTVLRQENDELFVIADGQAAGPTVQPGLHRSLSTVTGLSRAILNYVVHTHKSVVLENAVKDRLFGADSDLRHRGVKSVLCLPIPHKGELSLVLYLENNLIEGAFTENRLELLTLLSGQIAISLENALMYESLKTSIAERKHAEEVLRASEERLRVALEGNDDAIWDWDTRTNLAYFSPRYYTMLGYEPSDFPASYESWLQLLHPDDKEHATTTVEAALRSGSTFAMETRLRTKDGSWRWILSRGKVAESDEHRMPVRVAGSHTDINARKVAEAEVLRLNEELEERVAERTDQLQAANKELEAFAYSVSHDLRAPLRAIDGFSKILQEDHARALNSEGQRMCGIIRQQTERMGQLIDELLAFSRLGRGELHKSTVDMSSLALLAFKDLTADSGQARIDLQIDPLPPAIGDQALLGHVWTNLLSNAIKFSGKRERAVIAVRGSSEHDDLHYTVIDNGEGFDMRFAGKLFRVFQRLHSSSEFEGTGVGLAIVQRILLRHGGRIWAESQPGKGATFHFTLPKSV